VASRPGAFFYNERGKRPRNTFLLVKSQNIFQKESTAPLKISAIRKKKDAPSCKWSLAGKESGKREGASSFSRGRLTKEKATIARRHEKNE